MNLAKNNTKRLHDKQKVFLIKILILTFFTHLFSIQLAMSKLEFIDDRIKNAKINQLQFKKICKLFAYDYTASQTAKELGLSRQTINSYYKTIRESLIKNLNHQIEQIPISKVDKFSFELKYIKLKSNTIYFIELKNTPYIINTETQYFEEIYSFINNELKNTLIDHKRANCAKVLYNSYQNEFFVANYSKSTNDIEDFVSNRLKQFRGLNKNNIEIHIKESFIRFNQNQNSLYRTLVKTFYL